MPPAPCTLLGCFCGLLASSSFPAQKQPRGAVFLQGPAAPGVLGLQGMGVVALKAFFPPCCCLAAPTHELTASRLGSAASSFSSSAQEEEEESPGCR